MTDGAMGQDLAVGSRRQEAVFNRHVDSEGCVRERIQANLSADLAVSVKAGVLVP